MRLSMLYNLSYPYLPKSYLKGFMSLIKKSLEISNQTLYNIYYSSKKLKPFSFSIYFPELGKMSEDKFYAGNKVILNFSSNNMELITNIYNGFEKNNKFTLFDSLLTLENITLHPPKLIKTNKIKFKTLSPILVNKSENNNFFLLSHEDGFLEGLTFSITECAKAFLNKNVSFLEINSMVLNKVIVYHYQKLICNKGIIEIQSEPEILQMIYDIGIGVHRSQGFGLLEVIE